MSDRSARLDALELRIREHARRPAGAGLTEPDTDTQERWEAAQVWAHMAEFVQYWLDEAQLIMESFEGEPVPFGRVKTDPGRIAAIESGRHEPIFGLADRALAGLTAVRRFLVDLSPERRAAKGRHQTLGEMDVAQLLDHFIVSHLEEHLDQLDGLLTDRAS